MLSNSDKVQEPELQTIVELIVIEKQDLLFLREEEKLARDVHFYPYEIEMNEINFVAQNISLKDFNGIIESDKERSERNW